MKHRKPGIANSVYYMVTVEKVTSLYFCHFKKSDMNQFGVRKTKFKAALTYFGPCIEWRYCFSVGKFVDNLIWV